MTSSQSRPTQICPGPWGDSLPQASLLGALLGMWPVCGSLGGGTSTLSPELTDRPGREENLSLSTRMPDSFLQRRVVPEKLLREPPKFLHPQGFQAQKAEVYPLWQ